MMSNKWIRILRYEERNEKKLKNIKKGRLLGGGEMIHG